MCVYVCVGCYGGVPTYHTSCTKRGKAIVRGGGVRGECSVWVRNGALKLRVRIFHFGFHIHYYSKIRSTKEESEFVWMTHEN